MHAFEGFIWFLVWAGLLTFGAAFGLAGVLRYRRLMWTWALLGIPIAVVIKFFDGGWAILVLFISGLAALKGSRWHRQDLAHGGDLAGNARLRITVRNTVSRIADQHKRKGEAREWVRGGRLILGTDRAKRTVVMPVGERSGSHTLIVGATGSGKTVSEAWVAGRLVEAGHGAVVIDPKGDDLLYGDLRRCAAKRRVPFWGWSPQGPLAYNPYACGSETEIADKALAGETFTEPHYLRQAQRYIAQAVRTMHAAQMGVSPGSLMEHMDPQQVEVTARSLDGDVGAGVQRYLDSLTDRQKRDLAGVRDRLSILAESDLSQWLDPTGGKPILDLRRAISGRAVAYFRLDADRRPLVSAMLAAAIVTDLIAIAAENQRNPAPTVVVIDEFSAVAAQHVARLFGRARSAGMSLILATQELADLQAAAEGLREQVLGNVATVIAHRQNVPESAELISGVAGTRPAWITTHQMHQGTLADGPSGQGSRSRGYEFQLHPGQIKKLRTGQAAVITPGMNQQPAITTIHHPYEAHR